MRKIEECQAEVFRRSEQRIKLRNRRRMHFLMVCIPLVLCIAVLGPFLLPDKEVPNASGANPENTQEMYGGPAGAGGITGGVEVTGNGISHCYSSEEDVQRILKLLQELAADPEHHSGSEETKYYRVEGNFSSDIKENHRETGYRILVKGSDGTQGRYLLVGSLLIDETTREWYYLSEEDYFALKDALGIPFY